MNRLCLSFLVLLLFSSAARGEVPKEKIGEVLQITGIEKQIRDIQENLRAGLSQQQNNAHRLSPEVFIRLLSIIDHSYAGPVLYQSILDRMGDLYKPDQVAAILNLFQSPIAVKMSGMENYAPTPKVSQELLDFADRLSTTPPSRERFDLVQRLHEVSGLAQLSIDLQALTFMGMVRAYNAAEPPERRLEAGELDRLDREMKAQLADSFEDVAAVIYLYTYRNASNEEIAQYIDLHESDEVKEFTKRMQSALIEAMKSADSRVGAQLGNAM